VFGHGEETWADALGLRLAGRTLASVEVGTGGSLAALLGNAPFLALAEVAGRVSAGQPRDEEQTLAGEAERIRARVGSSVGLAVGAAERGGDTAVTVAFSDGQTTTTAERTCFLGGPAGRRRAALVACAELWRWLAPD
jgi:nicotinamide mononucleotide (NMN) deamidase PncC